MAGLQQHWVSAVNNGALIVPATVGLALFDGMKFTPKMIYFKKCEQRRGSDLAAGHSEKGRRRKD